MDAKDIRVIDETHRNRFIASADGADAELTYRVDGHRLVLLHTGVPAQFRGQGVGGRLVSAAVDRAHARGEVIVPRCSYARRWLRDHPDAAGDVSVEWPTESEN